jgi:ATP-dependent DNA ligase
MLKHARAHGLEGIIAKSRQSLYEPGERSGQWQKCKAEHEAEFLVGGYIPGASGFDELFVGIRTGKRVFYVSSVRAGFVSRTRRAITDAIAPFQTDKCPFFNVSEEKRSRWGRKPRRSEDGEVSMGYP